MFKYLAFFKISFIQTLKNYKALIGLSIFLITCLIIFSHIWKIAAAKVGVTSFDPSQLMWYIAFNEWLTVAIPDVQDNMEEDLRSGRLAYMLPRPISYLGTNFAEATGALTANLLFLGCATFAFTWLQVGALPFSLWGMIAIFFLSFLAGLVVIIYRMLIGISAFWLHDVDPFFWIWEKLMFMLGGLMLPLAAYPEWLQKLARLTPFPAILGDRSVLAMHFDFSAVIHLTTVLVLWGMIGCISLVLFYYRGLRILNIQGG